MLSDYILRLAMHGSRAAFVEQGVYRSRTLSYRQTLDRAFTCAAWLSQQNLGGQSVIIWAKPGAGWATAFYGCVLSGAVAVPIDAGFSADFVARVKEKTSAALIITDETIDALDALPSSPSFQPIAASRSDTAEIVFTSGTTSEPRGVVITHGNLLANLEPVEQEIARYRWMAWPFSPLGFINLIPLSHLFGQVMGLFIPQMLGGTVIFPESQSPAFIAETIRRRRASVMISVPQQLEALGTWTGLKNTAAHSGNERQSVAARWWRYRDLHRKLGWKMWAFVVGGAQLPPSVEHLWSALGYAVIQGYGLTETAPAVAITHPLRKGGGVGIRLAGVETRIADDGEILVRGPNVSPSAEIDAEGWLHSGDLGHFDEQGNLFYLGRKKDVIVTSNGLNVYPGDVERALEAQPEVKESAVVAREVAGRSTVHAVIVAQASEPALSAIVARANAQLEPHQRIQGFSLWPEATLPRTVSTKKLQRSAIAKWVNGETTPAGTTGASSWQDFFTQRGIALHRVTPGVRLEEDLGLSSLDRVELVTLLEMESAANLGATGAALQARLCEAAPDTPEPDWPRRGPSQALRAIFRPLVLFPLLRWYVKVESTGQENLAGVTGPVLFIANHQSFMDVPVILRALPRHWRKAIAPAMAPDNFPTTTRLNLARICFNGFLLSPDVHAVQGALRHAGKLVEAGYSVLVFPEGRRTPDGKIHPFRPGVGVMAERLGLPVVPIRIDGLYEVWPPHQYKPGKGEVKVNIGLPMIMGTHESPAAFVTRLEKWFETKD